MRNYRTSVLRAVSAVALNPPLLLSERTPSVFILENNRTWCFNHVWGAGAEERKHYPLGTAWSSLIQSVRTPRASWEGHLLPGPFGQEGSAIQPLLKDTSSSRTPALNALVSHQLPFPFLSWAPQPHLCPSPMPPERTQALLPSSQAPDPTPVGSLHWSGPQPLENQLVTPRRTARHSPWGFSERWWGALSQNLS